METKAPIIPPFIPELEPTLPSAASAAVTTPSDRRVLVALCFGTFVTALLFIVPTPFFPEMARELGVGVPLLGQVMSAMLLLSVVLGLIVGPLSDRSGYRLLIVIGLAAAAVCLFDFGLAPTFQVLLLASIAGGVTDAAVLGPSLAIAGTHFTGPAARRAIGWTSAAQAGSAVIGVPVLAAIGVAAGWRVAFIVAALAALAVVGLALLWLPRDTHRAAEPLHVAHILAPYRPLLRNRTMRRLYGATVLGAICWFGLLTYLGAFLIEALDLVPGQVGLVYMAAGSGYFAGSLAVGGPFARVPARVLVVGGYAATAVLMAIAFSARLGPVGSAVFISLAAVMMGLEVVGMAALLTAKTPTSLGTTMTLSGSLFNLGAAAGGAIGGALLALSGYGAMAIGLPIFGLAAALMCWHPGDEQRS